MWEPVRSITVRGEDSPNVTETITDAIGGILESLLAETDDEEVHFKLRTALQLLFVILD